MAHFTFQVNHIHFVQLVNELQGTVMFILMLNREDSFFIQDHTFIKSFYVSWKYVPKHISVVYVSSFLFESRSILECEMVLEAVEFTLV